MLFLILVLLGLSAFASAAPTSTSDSTVLVQHGARQIITANTWVSCCESCTTPYSQDTFLTTFTDFCGWANLGMELWTSQTYSTGTTYCQPGEGYCIELSVQYLCGGTDGNAADVHWDFCTGMFDFVIESQYGCPIGGKYPGARVGSGDGCWIYQATGNTPIPADSEVTLMDCDETGRWCTVAGTNATLPVPDQQWSEPIQLP